MSDQVPKVLGVLNIDLAKRVIQHFTGVATGSNAWQKHTPQTKVASDAGCRSTLRTHNRLLLQIEANRNAVHRNAQVKRQNEGARLTKIESLSLPLSTTVSPPFNLS